MTGQHNLSPERSETSKNLHSKNGVLLKTETREGPKLKYTVQLANDVMHHITTDHLRTF